MRCGRVASSGLMRIAREYALLLSLYLSGFFYDYAFVRFTESAERDMLMEEKGGEEEEEA